MNRPLLSLTLSLGLLPLAAAAEDETAIALDPVVVAGQTGEDGAAAGDIDAVVITEQELELLNPQDLQDVFITQPTVTVGGSTAITQKLYVQGVEETNLAVTIDGTRQNNKTFHHNATTVIDPDLLKAVRIDPGVAPADAGPGALGGAVAFETKDVDDLLAPGRSFGGTATGEYQTNGDIFSSSGTVYGRWQGFEGLVFGKFADGDLRRDGDGDVIVGSGTALVSALAKVAYEAPTGDRFEAVFEMVDDDDARPYRANLGGILGGRPTPLTRNYDLNRQNYTLTYTDATPALLWDPKVQIGYSVTDLAVTEDTQEIFGTTRSINGRAQNTLSGVRGTVTLGADFYVDEAELDYRYRPDPLFDERGSERAQNLGVYGQARLDLTERVRLSLGHRADFQRFEGVDGTEATNSGPSYNVSGEVDITSILTAHAGYAHVWAGIPLAENFIINPNWAYGDGLEPVTADNVVAGLKAHYRGWSAGARVFQTRIENARTPDYRLGPDLQRTIRTRGYELSAGYDWTAGFAKVAYAFIDADIDGRPADSEAGRYLTVPVGHVLSLSAAHTIAQWGLTVGADAQVAFAYNDTYDVDIGGRGDSLPGYGVVNAFAEYTPARFPNLTLRAEANNIFDESYAARGTYGIEYGTVQPLLEPGRSFLLKATARF